MRSTQNRLSVLVVTPKAVLGGAERWLLSLIDHSYRIDACVVCLEDGPLVGQLKQHGVQVRVVPTGTSPASLAAAAARLGRIIRDMCPDAILANGVKPALVALPAAKATGTAVVWMKHDPVHEDTHGRIVATQVDAVIAVSASEAHGSGRSDAHVISPAAVIESSLVSQLRTEASDELTLAMVGRLVPNKGYDSAIIALAATTGWSLVVYGTSDEQYPMERERLAGLATELGVSSRVSFAGDQPWSQISQADAVAVLSRPGGQGLPSREGYGLVPVEAALAGLPVIGDPRFVPSLRDVEPGVLEVDATQSDSITAALATLRDPARRTALGLAGRRAALCLPGPFEVANAVVDVLADVAGRPGAGRVGGPPMSVVTTVLNEGDNVDQLVDALLAQVNRPVVDDEGELDQVPDEVIIVDGGSSDGTWQQLVRRAEVEPVLTVVQEPGIGISAGRNVGIAKASRDWVACTDAGCVLADGWLDAFRRAAATDRYDLLTGLYRVTAPAGRAWQKAMIATGYPDVREQAHAGPWTRLYTRVFGTRFEAALPTGRSVAFDKRTWELAGGYPEDLPTAEDVMFGVNAVAAGARATLVNDAVVDWDQRPTVRKTFAMYQSYGRGDAQSGNLALIGKDVARALAYGVGAAMVARGGAPRVLAAAGLAAYVSVPMARAARRRDGVATFCLIPVMAAVRDLGKAAGCAQGFLERQSR